MREALAETGGSTAQPLPRGAVEAEGGPFLFHLAARRRSSSVVSPVINNVTTYCRASIKTVLLQ